MRSRLSGQNDLGTFFFFFNRRRNFKRHATILEKGCVSTAQITLANEGTFVYKALVKV